MGDTFSEMESHMCTDMHIIHINDIEIRLTLSVMKETIKVNNIYFLKMKGVQNRECAP